MFTSNLQPRTCGGGAKVVHPHVWVYTTVTGFITATTTFRRVWHHACIANSHNYNMYIASYNMRHAQWW